METNRQHNKQSTPKQDLINELHKPARKNYPRRRVIIKGIDDLWQADLAEFQTYASENKGYKFILVVIDCFSKFVWTLPIKNKSGEEVTGAITKIFSRGDRIPANLQTDNGKEFFNNHFQRVMKEFNINHYSTYSTMKASIVERVIRTLKDKLYRMFSLRGKYKYYDKLNEITRKYNNTVHRTIKMRPADVTKAKESKLLQTVYSHIKLAGIQKFHVGDIVRISKQKAMFDKGYTPNWSTELFKITKTKISFPTVYYLQDYHEHDIQGTFYAEELQKAKYEDLYLVEKILRKKGNMCYVKWLGFNTNFNSWIKKANIL